MGSPQGRRTWWGMRSSWHFSSRHESLTASFLGNSITIYCVEIARHPAPLPSRESVYDAWSAGSLASFCVLESRNSTQTAESIGDAALEGAPTDSSILLVECS